MFWNDGWNGYRNDNKEKVIYAIFIMNRANIVFINKNLMVNKFFTNEILKYLNAIIV